MIRSLLNENSLEELLQNGKKDKLILPFIWLSRDAEKMEELVKILLTITKKIASVDLHTEVPQITNIKTWDFYKNSIPSNIILVAPDKGAVERNPFINFNVQLIKKRINNQITTSFNKNTPLEYITDKDCLIIDDIIDTAKTVIAASNLLFNNGAKTVTVYATHAVLSSHSTELIQNSKIKKVYITDTISHSFLPNKFTVFPIIKRLENISF